MACVSVCAFVCLVWWWGDVAVWSLYVCVCVCTAQVNNKKPMNIQLFCNRLERQFPCPNQYHFLLQVFHSIFFILPSCNQHRPVLYSFKYRARGVLFNFSFFHSSFILFLGQFYVCMVWWVTTWLILKINAAN